MRKIFTIILLFVATTIKAQDTIKIPVPIARQIAKDLTICDSTKAILDLTKEQLLKTEDKIILKDSVINRYDEKCRLYDTMLVVEKQKFEVQSVWLKDLKKQNRTLKAKLLYTKITLSAATLFLGYLYITK